MDPETIKRHAGKVVGAATRELNENQMIKVLVCQIKDFACFPTQI